MSKFKNHKWSKLDDKFDFTFDEITEDDYVLATTEEILSLMRGDNISELPKIAIMLLMLTDYALSNNMKNVQDLREQYVKKENYIA